MQTTFQPASVDVGQSAREASGRSSPHTPFRSRIEIGQSVVRVTQQRSGVHLPRKTSGTLRALGLRGIGRVNYLPDDKSTWGAIRKVSHIVAAERTTWPPERESRMTGRKERRTYGTSFVNGCEIGLSDGSSIYIERYPLTGSESITWRTRAKPNQLVELGRKLLGWADVAVEIYMTGSADPIWAPIEDLDKVMAGKRDSVDVVRANGVGVSLVWQKSLEADLPPELGMVGSVPNWRVVARILDATGEGAVREDCVELSQQIRIVLKQELA